MKRLFRQGMVILCLLLAAGVGLSCTVSAQENVPEISIVDITEEPTQPPDSGSTVASISDSEFLPTDVQRQEEDGYQILRKTFVVDAQVNPSELMQPQIIWHGKNYQFWAVPHHKTRGISETILCHDAARFRRNALRNALRIARNRNKIRVQNCRKSPPVFMVRGCPHVLKEELAGTTETKTVKKTVSVTSKTKNRAAILAAQDATLPYREDGYEGELELDAANLVVEDGEKQSYSYTVTDTKEYTSLAANDPYLVPKTVQKNGVSLALSDLTWTEVGVRQDGSGLAASYTATAQYSGKAWGTKTTGYAVTLPYSGEVKKTVPGKVRYTLIYEEGKASPDSLEPSEAGQEIPPVWFLVGGSAVVLTAFAVSWIVHRRRR